MEPNQTGPNAVPADERMLAALAHLSAILPYLGVIAPIIIYATQREKSRYVAFQSLQAVVYQVVMLLLWLLVFLCYFLVFFGALFPSMARGANPNNMDAAMIWPFLLICLVFVVWIAYGIYALVAAYLTFQGRDFRYVLIGDWTERMMNR